MNSNRSRAVLVKYIDVFPLKQVTNSETPISLTVVCHLLQHMTFSQNIKEDRLHRTGIGSCGLTADSEDFVLC